MSVCRVRQTEGLELFDAARTALDYCGEKHGGNAESEAAFDRLVESGALREMQAVVLGAVESAGPDGITCKELALALGKGMNELSGRFSELCAKHMIRRKETFGGRDTSRRDGCAVWVANRQ